MSELAKVKEELKRYSIARIPFIALETIERTRALDALRDVSDELNLTFYVHSLSKGICDLKTGSVITDERTVYGAIDFFSEQMKHKQYMTLVLTEIPDISTDNSDAKQLYDLAMLANESGGMIIVLTNTPVWNQLQRLGMILRLDYPNEEEMYSIINDYIISLYMKKYLRLQFGGDFAEKIIEVTEGFTGADLESAIRDIAYRKLANDSFEYTEQSILEAFENVVPLSKVSPERIDAIRNWGKERAVPASGRPIGEQALTNSNIPKTRKVLI